MRTALFLAIVVFAGTGGEICTSHAMKSIGEVKDFSPRNVFKVLLRAFRVSWMWLGVLLSAMAFYAFLALLSWNPVSFVIPVTALSYAAGAFGARFILREKVSVTRWAGVMLVCIGVALVWVGENDSRMNLTALLLGLRWAVLVLAFAPFVYYGLAIYSAVYFVRAHRESTAGDVPASCMPPVSILKPVRGLDREAYENFASFCMQDYPTYEILFAVSEADDPAVPVIRKLIADFPERSIRLLIGTEVRGTNSKVCKLCRLVREARYDLLVISDSDVRVEPEYLRGIAAPFRDPEVGGVTALYRGLVERQLVSEIDCVGSSAEFCAGALVALRLEGLKFALGSTMATTRERLEEIGGFEALVNHHSDDFEFGKRLAEHGYRVELARQPVWMVFPAQTWEQYLRHELRWAIGLRHIRPWGHLGLVFTHGVAWALAAGLAAGSAWVAAGYLSAYFVLRSLMAWTVAVWALKDPVVQRKIWLLPLRDAISFLIWVASFFSDRIQWRGLEFTIREGRLVPVTPSRLPEPVAVDESAPAVRGD